MRRAMRAPRRRATEDRDDALERGPRLGPGTGVGDGFLATDPTGVSVGVGGARGIDRGRMMGYP